MLRSVFVLLFVHKLSVAEEGTHVRPIMGPGLFLSYILTFLIGNWYLLLYNLTSLTFASSTPTPFLKNRMHIAITKSILVLVQGSIIGDIQPHGPFRFKF
jgi:hypothetical protein